MTRWLSPHNIQPHNLRVREQYHYQCRTFCFILHLWDLKVAVSKQCLQGKL